MTQASTKNEKIKEFLEGVYGKELAENEVSDYKERFVKYASLLVQIDKKNKKGKKWK